MHFKSRIFFSLFLAASFSGVSHAAVIANWGSTLDNGDLEGVVGSFSSGVGGSIQGAGMHFFDDSLAGLIPGGEIVYSSAPDGVLDLTSGLAGVTGAIAENQYYQFSFTVAGLGAGQTLDLGSFAYSTRRNRNGDDSRTGWGESQLTWLVNDLAFTALDAAGGVNNSTVATVDNFVVSTGLPAGLINGDVVNFRLYAWGSDADAGSGTLGNSSTRLGAIEISGAAVPEPATYWLMGICMVGGVLFQRRRKVA